MVLGTHCKDGGLAGLLSVSVPCVWASPGSVTGVGHCGVGERQEAAEKELNPLLLLLPVSKRGTSLGWGAGCLPGSLG